MMRTLRESVWLLFIIAIERVKGQTKSSVSQFLHKPSSSQIAK